VKRFRRKGKRETLGKYPSIKKKREWVLFFARAGKKGKGNWEKKTF